MLPSIQNIKQFGNVIRDISVHTLFLIRIPFLDTDDVITAFARSTSLPSYKISVVEVPFQTQKFRIAGTAEFDGSWQVEFLCDAGHTIRNKLIGWMSRAYDPSILRNGAPAEYKVDNIQVHQLDRTGTTVIKYQFVGMFPTEVGQIELSHEATDPEKFPTTFTYDYWTMSGSVDSPISSRFFVGIDAATGFSGINATVGESIGDIAGGLAVSF